MFGRETQSKLCEVLDPSEKMIMRRRVESLPYMRSDGTSKNIEVALQQGSNDLLFVLPNGVAIKLNLMQVLRTAVEEQGINATKLFEEDTY